LKKIALQYQSAVFPNIIREYFQHIFLSELYKLPDSGKLLFKGGTALRIVYGSPRFSEDLDFSFFPAIKNDAGKFVESLFIKTLVEIERFGVKIDIGKKIGATSGGYFGAASFKMLDLPPVSVGFNVSVRNGKKIDAEIDSIASDFVPVYNLAHLPQTDLVEEKIFGALANRKKPRDFYDLYFIMRKGMLSIGQKNNLAKIKKEIIKTAGEINFRTELAVFLPAGQQAIARDFANVLEGELNRQIS
jgi:predicted nucleotidyltransferase component of viral defense system